MLKKKKKERNKYLSFFPKIVIHLLSVSEGLYTTGGWLRRAQNSQSVKEKVNDETLEGFPWLLDLCKI